MEDYSGKDMSDSGNRSENRKSNKPIMEKRRRARINYCLNELKSLILDAMKKDPARHSKLEKADILEMTVKHLQNVQRQQLAMAVSSDPTVLSKFKNGFSECANEVSRYVSRIEGVDQGVCQRMITHLTRCMSNIQAQPIGLNPLGTTASVPTNILPNNPYLGRSDLLHPPPPPPPASHGLPDANFHTRLLTSLKAMQHLGDLSLAFFPQLRESQVTLNPLNMIPTSFNNNNNNNVGTTKLAEKGGEEGEKEKEQSAFLPVKRARSPSPPPLREKLQPSNNHKRLKSSVPDERCDTALSLNNNVIEKHSPRLEREDIPCHPNRNIHTPPSSPLPDRKEASNTDMWRPW